MSYLSTSDVRELCILLDEELARSVHFPILDEVESLVEKGEFDASLLERLDYQQHTLRDTETFTAATMHAIEHFAFAMLPNIQKISFVGIRELSMEGISWYGKALTVLPSDCLYLKRITDALKNTDKVIEYGDVYDIPGICRYCLAEWSVEHRSAENDLKVCPGLGGNDTD